MLKAKALIVAVHHWNSPFQVGTHYIARYFLEKGFEVGYVSAPITPLHHFRPATDDLIERRANHASHGRKTEKGLWHYVPSSLLAPDNRPVLSSSWVLNRWQSFSRPNVVQVVKDAGFGDVDVLFMDSIYQPFWLSSIQYNACAYRLADNSSGFAGYSHSASMVESRIIQTADVVFCAANGLQDYARQRGAKSVEHLPNGIDLKSYFHGGPAKNLDLPAFEGPVAIYVGAFDYWFDHSAIHSLATAIPDLNILLLGPTGKWAGQYSASPNVHTPGPVSAEQLPAYLALADVGLIPFDVKQYPALVNDVNPLKLYEYMAAGLPVVASRWEELERLSSPAVLVDNNDQFVSAVKNVLTQTHSGEAEKHFAGQFDWQHTLAPLGVWLDKNKMEVS